MSWLSKKNLKLAPLKAALRNRIHILEWFPDYTKFDAVSDLVAGVTVGMTMIPQSIAYAGLAGLPAQYGLYTAVLASLAYTIFGTVKQVSMGPTSLMSILTFTYVEKHPIEVVALLTFLTGCIDLLFGILNLGFVLDFFSPCVSTGFTSAVAFIVMIAQLKNLLGLTIDAHGISETLYEVCRNISKIKVGDTILGVSCIVFLFAFKCISRIPIKNRKLKKSLWLLSISRNAIIVLVSAIIASYCVNVNGHAPFKLSGKIPSGLPNFTIPAFSVKVGNETLGFFQMVHTLGTGILVIPVCVILANVSIAKSFSNGMVNVTQEMIALGICNILGGCVGAMPASGALSRSAVSNSSGVRTPLQGIYVGTIIMLALSFLTPYFSYIPKATLAAVLISAVTTMINYEILPILWKSSKFDFWINILTCAIGVMYRADVAILIGAALNLTILLKTWARPTVTKKLQKSNKQEAYLYIKPELGLYYPGVDYFAEEVLKAYNDHKEKNIPIAIDCKNILRLDYAGALVLKDLINTYNTDCRRLFLLNVNSNILETLKHFLESEQLPLCQSTDSICNSGFEHHVLINSTTPLLINGKENKIKRTDSNPKINFDRRKSSFE